MDGISSDLLVRILTFLSGRDGARCMLINKKFHALSDDSFLWSELCRQERQAAALPEATEVVAYSLNNDVHVAPPSRGDRCAQIRKQLRQYEALGRLHYLQWRRMQCSRRLERMEAHTLNAILDGRYAAVVGGWAEMSDNRVDVFDCRPLAGDEAGTRTGSTLPLLDVVTVNAPRFRYGFSTVEHEGELLVYGGMRSGGYSRDCSDLYRIGLQFHLSASATSPAAILQSHITYPVGQKGCWDDDWAAIKGLDSARLQRVTATYSADLTAVPAAPAPATTAAGVPLQQHHHPHTRGYHSAVVVRLDGRPTMLVWGGLHQRGPTAELELLDLLSYTWRKGEAAGQEPSPRFGHSCVALPSSLSSPACSTGDVAGGRVDRLIFTGGSDGSDLVRNGRELREIHVMHIVRVGGAENRTADALVWSSLRMDAVAPSLRASAAVPGRCHCAVGLGAKVLLFGGGAVHSNRVHVIETPRWEAGQGLDLADAADAVLLNPAAGGSGYVIQIPEVAGDAGAARIPPAARTRHRGRPLERCSAAAALVMGRFWLVLGGFSVKYSQMNDLWVLDLAYGAAESRNSPDSGGVRTEDGAGDGSDADDDDDDEGEEDEDGDEDGDGEEWWEEQSDGSMDEEDGDEEGAAWMAGAPTGAAMLWAQQLLAGWGGQPVSPLAQQLAAMLQSAGQGLPLDEEQDGEGEGEGGEEDDEGASEEEGEEDALGDPQDAEEADEEPDA